MTTKTRLTCRLTEVGEEVLRTTDDHEFDTCTAVRRHQYGAEVGSLQLDAVCIEVCWRFADGLEFETATQCYLDRNDGLPDGMTPQHVTAIEEAVNQEAKNRGWDVLDGPYSADGKLLLFDDEDSETTVAGAYAMNLKTRQLLDINTAHITQRDSEILPSTHDPDDLLVVYPYEFGWCVPVLPPDDLPPDELRKAGYSEAFFRIYKYAQQHRIALIQIDRDGDEHDGLEKFDW